MPAAGRGPRGRGRGDARRVGRADGHGRDRHDAARVRRERTRARRRPRSAPARLGDRAAGGGAATPAGADGGGAGTTAAAARGRRRVRGAATRAAARARPSPRRERAPASRGERVAVGRVELRGEADDAVVAPVVLEVQLEDLRHAGPLRRRREVRVGEEEDVPVADLLRARSVEHLDRERLAQVGRAREQPREVGEARVAAAGPRAARSRRARADLEAHERADLAAREHVAARGLVQRRQLICERLSWKTCAIAVRRAKDSPRAESRRLRASSVQKTVGSWGRLVCRRPRRRTPHATPEAMLPNLGALLAQRKQFVDRNAETTTGAGTATADERSVLAARRESRGGAPRASRRRRIRAQVADRQGGPRQLGRDVLPQLARPGALHDPEFRRADARAWPHDFGAHGGALDGGARACRPAAAALRAAPAPERAAVPTTELQRSFGWTGAEAFVQHTRRSDGPSSSNTSRRRARRRARPPPRDRAPRRARGPAHDARVRRRARDAPSRSATSRSRCAARARSRARSSFSARRRRSTASSASKCRGAHAARQGARAARLGFPRGSRSSCGASTSTGRR